MKRQKKFCEKNMEPLTKKERQFAEEHHTLVFKFLYKNGCNPDEYYDVVILTYLRIVKKYFAMPELQRYAFTTIAWRALYGCISNYRRKTALEQSRVAFCLDDDSKWYHEVADDSDPSAIFDLREEIQSGWDALNYARQQEIYEVFIGRSDTSQN